MAVSKMDIVKTIYNRPTASQAAEKVLEELFKEEPKIDLVKLAETADYNVKQELKRIAS